MVPLQIEHVVEREITPREGFLERLQDALILLSLAAVTVGWCSFLALMFWKGCAWIFALT